MNSFPKFSLPFKGLLALYALCITVLSPVVGFLFLFHPRGRIRLRERFGIWNLTCNTEVLWLHAASLGEARGLLPILKQYRENHPKLPILVTSLSPSAAKIIEGECDFYRLMPFDSPLWIYMALRNLKIRALVVTETELWPTLIAYITDRSVRLILINARISDFSWPSYKKLRAVFRPLLQRFSGIAFATPRAQERFSELGAAGISGTVTGNTKYDFTPSVATREEAALLKTQFFQNEYPVLTLASLHPGEEQWWLAAILEARKQNITFNVLLAPRHSERFEYFAQALQKAHLSFVRRSTGSAAANGEVLLLDTIGELEKVYSFTTLTFIGGTLVPKGGHNLLEAAAYGNALAIGESCTNIQDEVQRLQDERGIVMLHSVTDMHAALQRFKNPNTDFAALKQAAHTVYFENRGATKKVFEFIEARSARGAKL
jgi:3-deoxy-D-manno-octulosonic-acid transferase